MIKVLSLTLTFLCLSCANTQIKSSKEIPLSFNGKKGFNQNVKIELTKEFFLWGTIPTVHEINLDEAIVNQGYNEISEVSIQHKNRTSDVIWTILTFGVYTPQTYYILGKSSIE